MATTNGIEDDEMLVSANEIHWLKIKIKNLKIAIWIYIILII